MITVQSYSKNMGLYAERAGLVSFTCQDAPIAERLGQQLRRTIRLTHSSPPQHGGALVATILGEPERSAAWRLELAAMAARLHAMRRALMHLRFLEETSMDEIRNDRDTAVDYK